MSDDERILELKEYVDRRLSEFRDELLDYLDSIKSRDVERVRRELTKLLIREIEGLRSELLSEVRSRGGDLEVIARRIDELSREVSAIRQLVSNQPNIDAVRREVEAVEARLRWFVIDRVNEIEVRRRRSSAKKAVLLLLGIAVGVAVVIALSLELAPPWLIPLIIIMGLILLRR